MRRGVLVGDAALGWWCEAASANAPNPEEIMLPSDRNTCKQSRSAETLTDWPEPVAGGCQNRLGSGAEIRRSDQGAQDISEFSVMR
jgi:hypothetical protein